MTDPALVATGVGLVTALFVIILAYYVMTVGWRIAICAASIAATVGAVLFIATALVAAGTTEQRNPVTCTKSPKPTDGRTR